MVCKFYKGRLGIIEALNSPIRLLHQLYYMAIQKSLTDEGQEEIKAEAMAEAMTGGVG